MNEIKKLDMENVNCPICSNETDRVPMIRIDDTVVCEKCGYSSPILQVVHRKKK